MKWEIRLKIKRNQKWNEKWNEKQNQIKSKIKNEIKNKNNLKVKLNWKNNLGTKRASWPRCANENQIEFKKQLWDETCHPGRDVPWEIRISKKTLWTRRAIGRQRAMDGGLEYWLLLSPAVICLFWRNHCSVLLYLVSTMSACGPLVTFWRIPINSYLS